MLSIRNRSYQWFGLVRVCGFKRCPNSYREHYYYYCSKSDRNCEMAFPLVSVRFDIKSIWLIYLIVFSSYVLISLEFLVLPGIVFVLLLQLFLLLLSIFFSFVRYSMCTQQVHTLTLSRQIWTVSQTRNIAECGKQIYSYIIYFEINVSFNCNRKLVLFVDRDIDFLRAFVFVYGWLWQVVSAKRDRERETKWSAPLLLLTSSFFFIYHVFQARSRRFDASHCTNALKLNGITLCMKM